MIRAEILTIGRELLQGKTLNTNAKFLSERLTQIGICVEFHSSCDDDQEKIVKAINLAFKRTDLVILTGGLGPTPDDVTREAVAQYFDTDLKFHPAQYAHILRYFKKRKQKPTLITKEEACFPRTGKPIVNGFGIALGFSVEYGKKLLIALPGVPRELEALYKHSVERLILTKFKNLPKMHSFSVSVLGLDESEIMNKLGKSLFRRYLFEFGSYPMGGRVVLRFRTPSATVLQGLKREVSKNLGKFIYAWRDASLEAVIGEILAKRKWTLATAESCTGGLLAKRITDIPGSSRYFLGSVIAYANRIKEKMLFVSPQTLKTYGAVSKEAAGEMARGICRQFASTIGVSVTGIAGPGGGTRSKPVGLVWISLSSKNQILTKKILSGGERDRIRYSAAHHALALIYQYLSRHSKR